MCDGEVWTGLTWLRLWTGGGCLSVNNVINFGFCNMQGIFRLAEELLASQGLLRGAILVR